MRKNIVNITNDLASDAGLDFEILRTYKLIFEYNKNAGTLSTPRRHNYELKNGCLFINGALIDRVEPLPHRTTNDAATDYYEARILARQENIYNN